MARVRLSRTLSEQVARKARVASSVSTVAQQIAAETRRRVPVDTGRLRASVRVEDRDGVTTVVMGNRQTFYSQFIEFGGGSQPPEAPLRRAAETVGNFQDERR